ncbi:protein of unknown function [Trichlorobacter ammonificans]|uniref:Uncharacterized protein n=1 Tax=Trichlorobacter ammonificans TaxID=2916410 RepID=A0ABM9DD33_9BACT|nr:protein of unknown function [Trichlorobacter ammonificans]
MSDSSPILHRFDDYSKKMYLSPLIFPNRLIIYEPC